MKSYRQRLTMPHLGNMIGGIALALALSIAVFWLPATPDGEAPLATLVLFLVIALFMLSQLQSLSKIVVNFYIFNAYFQRAFRIISGHPIRPEPTSAAAGDLEPS